MTEIDELSYAWRDGFENEELEALHGEGFGHAPGDYDWRGQLERHSLGWVCARTKTGQLAGFVNVAWDGGAHAFILDAVVAASRQRRGVGAELIAHARQAAHDAGCEWLHVDFEEHLAPFYFERCGFDPTLAGLVFLRG